MKGSFLKEKESLSDEGVGYGDFPFTRDEFLDVWEYLALLGGYDSSKSDKHNKKFCYEEAFDEKRVFLEYNGFQFILSESRCGAIDTSMIIPHADLPWEDNKKVCINE